MLVEPLELRTNRLDWWKSVTLSRAYHVRPSLLSRSDIVVSASKHMVGEAMMMNWASRYLDLGNLHLPLSLSLRSSTPRQSRENGGLATFHPLDASPFHGQSGNDGRTGDPKCDVVGLSDGLVVRNEHFREVAW